MTDSTQLYASDFRVGDRFEGADSEITEQMLHQFAHMTGDTHPIHYDEEYARTTRFGARVAHGLMLMSLTALGATRLSERLEDSMVALAEQGCRFSRPVFLGNRLHSAFEVEDVVLKPAKNIGVVRFAVTLANGSGEVVLEGHHVYLLRGKKPA